MELAGTLARELQELKADLGVDSQELKETEEAYQVNLRQAKLAQREFEDKVRRLDKQLSQVKIKEAQAEAAAALSSVAFKVGDLGDTMKTRRRDPAEALRSVGRQGAACERHGGHGGRHREGKRAQGARAGGARRVPGRAGHPGHAAGRTADAGQPQKRSDLSDERAAALHGARQAHLDPARRGPGRARGLHDPARGDGGGSAPSGDAEAERHPPVTEVRSRCPKLSPPAPFSSRTTSSRSRSASMPATPG